MPVPVPVRAPMRIDRSCPPFATWEQCTSTWASLSVLTTSSPRQETNVTAVDAIFEQWLALTSYQLVTLVRGFSGLRFGLNFTRECTFVKQGLFGSYSTSICFSCCRKCQVVVELLSEKLEGFSGEEEPNQKLRQLWQRAWERTSVQVTATRFIFLVLLCFRSGIFMCCR